MKIVLAGIAILLVVFLSGFSPVLAQKATSRYTVLAPLPGTTECGTNIGTNTKCQTDLPTYFKGAFNLMIGLAALLAFGMITYAGVLYATTESLTGKSNAKQKITDAVWGLVLVIASYTIVYTILGGKDGLSFNLKIEPIKINPWATVSAGGGPLAPGYNLTADEKTTNTDIANDLPPGVTSYVGDKPCTATMTTGCVNLVGIPPETLGNLSGLSKACGNCSVAITGGTEGGHKDGSNYTHSKDSPVVDVATNPQLDSYIQNNMTPIVGQANWYSGQINGKNSVFYYEGDHWHIITPAK